MGQLAPRTPASAPAGRDRFPCWPRPSQAATALAFLIATAGLVLGPQGAEAAVDSRSSDFHTLTPCRLIDTRLAPGPLGGPALAAGTTRAFAVVGRCQIPLSAVAMSVNVAVVSPAAPGHLRLFASGTPLPDTSTINYAAGQTRAGNAIVALGTDGVFVAYANQAGGTTHLVVDVTGYFATSGCSSAQTPASPLLTVDTGARTLSWPEVQGATSYDLYVRPESGDCGLLPPLAVTRTDQKFSDVTSPLDLSGFNTCGMCYFVDVAAVSGDCESPLRSDLGLPAPLALSLRPCVP
jgi:hypothetical protein